ncbi:MAG: hypothetical protein RBS13_04970 [Bacteroidales bacterium]|jgi:hypothetical protein|nr:hypothetical protein [Bacteroidales bacterium]
MLAQLISGIILIIIGVVAFYLIYKLNNHKKEGFAFNIYGFLLFLSIIFIVLCWQGILQYIFNIDGFFRTTEVDDNMTFKNGITLFISVFAISGWTEVFIKRIKKYRISKKQTILD